MTHQGYKEMLSPFAFARMIPYFCKLAVFLYHINYIQKRIQRKVTNYHEPFNDHHAPGRGKKIPLFLMTSRISRLTESVNIVI